MMQILSGVAVPFEFPGPSAFSGREKVQCVMSFGGVYNPAAIAATVDFTVVVTCVIIKSDVLRAYDRYLKTLGAH